MKTTFVILLLLLPVTPGIGATKPAAAPSQTSTSGEEASPAMILASQVAEIASTPSLSHKEMTRLIAKAVRTAVSAVIEGIKDSTERLSLARNLAAAAAKAAPNFSDTIIDAVSNLPAFVKVDGAAAQIEEAVNTSIETSDDTTIANPAVNPPRPSAAPDFGGPNRGEVVVSPSS